MITRFAPSPTGFLHLGNARTALLTYFYTRSNGGRFLLRIDDTDNTRIKTEFVDQIKKDLSWLQIECDDIFYQSERFEKYKQIFDDLISKGIVYPCFETKEELELKRQSLLKRGLPPVYDRASLKLCDHKSAKRVTHYRFKINQDQVVTWEDKLRGKITIDLKSTSDPVLLRENGVYTYMLPSVVDDIDYGITTVVRGEDHICNTAVQIQMLKAIGVKNIPEFIHLPLVKIRGDKISKRVGGYEIKALKKQSIEPESVINYLVNLGSNKNLMFDKKQYEKGFDIKSYSSASPTLCVDDLLLTNQKFLQSCSFEYIKNRLPSFVNKEFWDTCKKNITKITEVKNWYEICRAKNNIKITCELKLDLLKDALRLLPKKLDDQFCKDWIAEIFKVGVYTTKDINKNLRLCMTGLLSGPGLLFLLKAIGRDEVYRRLDLQINEKDI